MKQWKCTVCGYIHQGKYPPKNAPQCGADINRFILLEECPPGLKRCSGRPLPERPRPMCATWPSPARPGPRATRTSPGCSRPWPRLTRVHADEYLVFLAGVVGSTEQNLKRAFENEMAAKQDYYPPIIKQAFDQKAPRTWPTPWSGQGRGKAVTPSSTKTPSVPWSTTGS